MRSITKENLNPQKQPKKMKKIKVNKINMMPLLKIKRQNKMGNLNQ